MMSNFDEGFICDSPEVTFSFRHCEEPTGPAFGGLDDKLRDEAIHCLVSGLWIASLRSQ
jgi:hypothetical protein